MCGRIPLRSSLRIILVLLIGIALLPAPCVSLLVNAMGQGRGPRTTPPRPGKPEGLFPNLDDMKDESRLEREPPPPIPSTIRSHRNSGKPWDGRRVGDPEPPRNSDHAGTHGQTLRAHARRRMRVLPLLYEDQFIQNFFNLALVRSATYEETLYWNYQLRAGYNESAASLKLTAIELGRTLFESAAYAARNRDAHGYVYDLYKTYLMREPDAGGWTTWENLVGSHGSEYVRRGFEESGEFATLLGSMTLSGPASSTASSLISARVDPRNQPGNGMLARDAAWSVPLLSLPGRNGLDLGLALSYSSTVWTRSGPYIYFDEDNGFPSPGFRLGFPTVQRKVFDAQTGRKSYLLITGGKRVELRQVGTSNIYDAADSSYLRLTDNGSTLLVHSTDGTKLSLSEINGEYRCVEIKDSNGNYITVNNNALGRISSIVDTLGRVINFNYDGNANLISITQSWNGQPSHQWVSFGWGTRTMQSSFSGAAMVGITNGTVLPVITQVGLNDTSYFTFDYTNSLQVSLIKKYFGTVERNATSFTYETPGSDVPRLISSSVSAQNWTGVNGVPSQVTTQYSVGSDGACVLTAPDGTIYREYYGTGWQRGLTTLSEVWSGGVRQKWTTTAWTQDNTSVSYEVNPRVIETNVYDAGGNRRRTVIDYGAYGLPSTVHEYAADGGTEIRQTVTDYNLSQAYLDRRIIGLVSQVRISNTAQTLTKITYDYDDPARLHGVPAAATQHDVNYNLALTARGNVTAVSRWDVNDINNASKKLTSYTNYYNTGTPISTTDAAGHQSSVTYGDSFSDSVNRNTFAYPTTITDADNFSSFVQYNFDFGATTRTQSPTPASQSQGAIQMMSYNNLGQLERVITTNNGAYKRFWYGADYTASYATVNNVTDEAYAIAVVDGVGRVIGAASNHPGSSGGYSLVNTIYNQMGRPWKVSNPTEVNSSWAPSGDDAAGIYYTQQTYDWKGRPLVTTNPDGTTKEASYAGCGCAGGEVMTSRDEVGRRQKVYADVLGRSARMEVLNPDGSPYATTVKTYNVRDQVTLVRQYQGADTGSIYQDITTNYDGYGRLSSQHEPEQAPGHNTVFTYTADDTLLTSTDGRGATTTYAYNARHLVTGISYTAPSGILVPATATFSYDAARNRTVMIDGLGRTDYQYDQLSRLTSESRRLNALPNAPVPNNAYTISYSYNLAGALLSITDPFGKQVSYVRDITGRLTSVSRPGYAGLPETMSSIQYRAWGRPKQVTFTGNNQSSIVFYGYDARMVVGRFQLTPQNGGTIRGAQYSRYADGQVSYAQDLSDSKFDRAYFYDEQMGRVTQGLSGGEARGAGTTDGPYNQTYGYDAFNNLTGRGGRFWTKNVTPQNFTYVNNRNMDPQWQYDFDGRPTQSGTQVFRYDAAGREINSSGTAVEMYDGDGRRLKNAHINPVNYELRSTVLGGQIVTYLFANGEHGGGIIYADGNPVARVQYDLNSPLGWELHTPINSGMFRVMMGVSVERYSEFSPIGDGVGTENPFLSEGGGSGLGYPSGGGDPSTMRCALDGREADCNSIYKFFIRRSYYDFISLIITKRFSGTVTSNRAVLVPGGSHEGNVVYGTAGPGGTPSSVDIIGEPDYFELTGASNIMQSFQQVTKQTIVVLNPERRLSKDEYLNIRKEMATALQSRKCRDFIDRLIGYNQGTPYDSSEDFLALSDYIYNSSDGGVFWGLPTQVGNKVRIGSDIRPDLNMMGNAAILMHELIHRLQRPGGADYELANNIRALGIVPVDKKGKALPFPTGMRDGKPFNDWSGYWGTALNNACFPKLPY